MIASGMASPKAFFNSNPAMDMPSEVFSGASQPDELGDLRSTLGHRDQINLNAESAFKYSVGVRSDLWSPRRRAVCIRRG
jgi:hypothetical protein